MPSAEKCFEKAAENYPWFSGTFNTWGDMLYQQGDRDEGVALFERGYGMDEYNLTTYLNRTD